MTRHWPVQDAKARFTELLNTALTDGPQIVTRRGKEEAVLMSIEQWRRVGGAGKPNLIEFLLGPGPRYEEGLPYPSRKHYRLRKPPKL